MFRRFIDGGGLWLVVAGLMAVVAVLQAVRLYGLVTGAF